MARKQAVLYKCAEACISEKLTISDRCSNQLVFTKKADNSVTFEYEPINHFTSNSGRGSDAKPVFKNLQTSEWINNMAAYTKAKNEGATCHGRVKGTSLLQYQSGTISDTLILQFGKPNDDLLNFFYTYIT
jgi:hypothetical protein